MLGDTFGIGQLFALSRDPVICVRGGTVLSMNPPAVNLFGGDRTGCNAAQLLPETILSAESERFIAGTVVNGQIVPNAVLNEGDRITLGLTNFIFTQA